MKKFAGLRNESVKSSISMALWSVVFILLFSLKFFPPEFLQPVHAFRGPKPPGPEQLLSDLTQELSLNETQVEKIQSIIEDHTSKREALFEQYANKGRSARREMKPEMDAPQADLNTSIEAVLTEEQIVKYQVYQEKKRQEMQATMGKNYGGRGGGRRF